MLGIISDSDNHEVGDSQKDCGKHDAWNSQKNSGNHDVGTVRMAAVFMVLGTVSDIGHHYDGDSGNRDVGDSQW